MSGGQEILGINSLLHEERGMVIQLTTHPEA